MKALMEKASEKFQSVATDENGRVLPYAVAWFFGVPISLLVLVWLFMHVAR